ncbi:hypothetical protein JB92DRAFT_2688545 [Gautieria morchelliformis]|nr:hypothetical protein JB92DRAFT_2688545 [Gautieria morchelliformis]
MQSRVCSEPSCKNNRPLVTFWLTHPRSQDIQSQAKSASTPSFEAALVLNAAVFGAELLAFTLLRKQFKSIYEPRSFLTPPNKRVSPLPTGLLAWPLAVWRADPLVVREQNGLDAYMFLRFLRMMVKILFPIWLVSWLVLLPVTSVGTSMPGRTGLDRFTFGNVAPNVTDRYAAHLLLAYLFTGYILYTLQSELRLFVSTRQRHLISPAHSSTPQANTVLVTGVPSQYLSTHALTRLFSHVPGGVRRVWLNRDLKDLPDVYDARMAACNKLESAENALLKTATKIHKQRGEKAPDTPDVELGPGEAEDLVPSDKRPTHRLPVSFLPFSLPLIGKKVDSITWARAEIVRTNALLEQARAVVESEGELPGGAHEESNGEEKKTLAKASYPPLSSAFILFHQQIGAHMAAQILVDGRPLRMADKYIEVAPPDVVWGNLGLNPYEARIRRALSWALTIGLIIVWAIPVAFIGIVSNIAALCTTYKWLAWLCTIPPAITGIIQGILPPVLLAVLFMLLPIVLRLLARFEGVPTRVGIELSLMDRFFLFQVIHGFLIVTLSSGIIAALPGIIKNPANVPSMLALKLPDASTFFLTYIILQGLSGTAGGFLNIVPLIIYYVKLTLLGSTPRSIYSIRYTLRDVAWGTLWPGVTLLVVITIGYSVISPIINGLAVATFFLFYMLYKYLFTWQLQMNPAGDSGGLFFPRAINHVFVGVYVQQVCLCALFFLAQNDRGKQAAVPEGALMVVLIVVTAFFQNILNTSYTPLLKALPLTLADRSHGMPGAPRADVAKGGKAAGAVGKEKVSKDDTDEDGYEGDGEDDRHPGATSATHEHPYAATADASPYAHPLIDEYLANDPSFSPSFTHPAIGTPQRPIWVAADSLGIGLSEVKELHTHGIRASVGGARMDAKGNVEVWSVGEGDREGEEEGEVLSRDGE